jgi:hypothetical protein
LSLATDVYSASFHAFSGVAKMWRSETSAGEALISQRTDAGHKHTWFVRAEKTRSASLTFPPVMVTRDGVSAHEVKLSLPERLADG